MTPSGLEPGTIFADRYRIVRCIAHGGMGAVYEVIHLETERHRALKVMLPHVLQSAELRQRFQREAKIAANVHSDFIVDVFDAGYDEATQMPFLVMELLRGEEVSKRLKRLGRLSAGEALAIIHQTALALDKTHRASIVHRDLKPENLFLTETDDGQPRVKVLDFGIAKVMAENATTGGATQSLGTPLYMAPEQFNPNAQLTGAADLYALAMVAYKLLVGRAYWAAEAKGGNVFALAAVTIHGPQEPASARAAACGVQLAPSFDAWFARATAVDPRHRFASGAEMVTAMAHALGALPSFDRVSSVSAPLAFGATPASSYRAGSQALLVSAREPEPASASYTIPMASPFGASSGTPLPSATPMPASAPAPSLPTGIVAPATAGPTAPPPVAVGPSRGAVVAVALTACGVLAAVGWVVVQASAPAPASSTEPVSTPRAASSAVVDPVTAPPLELETPKPPPPAIAASTATPAEAPSASASSIARADVPRAAPTASPVSPAAAHPPPPPPKRKYTRE